MRDFVIRQLGILALAVGTMPLPAQFNVAGKDLQFHGFFQQGFAYSSGNNFLTMNTTAGSFAMTDGGLNVSTRLTPRLRVGAQVFSRNIGELGNGKVSLDWAYADYKFNEFVGVRAGKVKTTLGLFTDTQDMEFLYVFALLPQSVYPTDLRASTIAHNGADIYGELPIKKAGRIGFTGYIGTRPNDPRGGYYLGGRDGGFDFTGITKTTRGGDVRWMLPIEGLVAGFSAFDDTGYATAFLRELSGISVGPRPVPIRIDLDKTRLFAYYGDFQRAGFRISSELWRSDTQVRISGMPIPTTATKDEGWYVMGSYRLNKRLEFGSYYSQFRQNRDLAFDIANGTRDRVVTARVDLNKYWNVKVEGHFMNGYGSPFSFRSFYPSSNPRGMKPDTNMLLIRTGISF